MKIGVLGGTFNPPHTAHMRAAELVGKALDLDKILIIPANVPPHKAAVQGSATTEQRIEMVRLAIEGLEKFELDTRETDRGGVSYTIDTYKSLREQYPEAEIWFICGTDMFLSVQNWREAQKLLAGAGFAAVPRKEGDLEMLQAHALHLAKEYNAKTFVLEAEPLEVSSTQLREGSADISKLHPHVYRYISKNSLYGF